MTGMTNAYGYTPTNLLNAQVPNYDFSNMASWGPSSNNSFSSSLNSLVGYAPTTTAYNPVPQYMGEINQGAYNSVMNNSGFTGTDSGGGGGGGLTAFGPNGYVMPAVAGIQTLLGGYLGMKQYGLAKDAFNENKRQFNMNWNANKTLTNARLEDRQHARVASNPGAYQSVGDYMAQNAIK